jgi:hypothetical protein
MKLNETEKQIHQTVTDELSLEKVASPDHVERMTGWCQKIGPSVGADMETLVADALEYIGAIGVLRAVVRGLTDGSFSGRISEFPEYLRNLLTKVEGTFHTDMARRIGTERIAYMHTFLGYIEKELRGEI